MDARAFRCVTLSDFNLDNFNALLANDAAHPSAEVIGTGFGQLYPCLLDPEASCWREQPDGAIVWTRPETVSPAFERLQAFAQVALEEILAEVETFAHLVTALRDRVGTVFVPTWTTPPEEHGLGLLDMRDGIGIANTVMRMNLRLSEVLDGQPGCYVLNAQRWVHQGGRTACNPKLWAMAKIPFSNSVFKAAVADVKAAVRAVNGEAKKLIVVDLDNTLWGGIVGDDGWEQLQLGGHDPVGEAFVAFQHALKAMTNRGILLGIVSKNTEEVAGEAFANHPEMVLSLDDFAGWRINWDDKAKNIAELVDELNLGLQSVVFIDDNAFERERVRAALPDVFVPDWPDDRLLYRRTLLSLDCFDTPTLTNEDRRRAAMYAAEKERASLKTQVSSLDRWLETLGLKVQVESPTDANLARIVQLLNKTNQMNLRTRRMTNAELVAWLQGEGHCLKAFRVSDRFGDSGLTGILSLKKQGDEVHVADFVLSCRVMGRRVEETMLAVATNEARRMGAGTLIAEYLPTAKNKPCLEFWKRSGLQVDVAHHTFRWSLNDTYPVPAHITLVQDEA